MLWSEFKAALEGATHILVLGHALNDQYVLEALNDAASTARLGYVAHAAGEPKISKDKEKALRNKLPQAVIIPGEFGPEPQFDDAAFDEWKAGATA